MTIDIPEIAAASTSAWNGGSPDAVASLCARSESVVMNRGALREGREGATAKAAGFFADVPDPTLKCDGVRVAGGRVAHLWTFTGRHAETGDPLRTPGREEWNLDADGKVAASLGWCDDGDDARQVAGKGFPACRRST